MDVSLVVPTYNNNARLDSTLEHLLASDLTGLESVEMVVVDDGSPFPVAPLVSSKANRKKFLLKCVRQENSGPAAARNMGFRASRGSIVIFVDDDILVHPDLICRHVDAHRMHPGAVICGRCPLIQPAEVTPLYQYIVSRGFDPAEHRTDEFVEAEIVSSGNISVERTLFSPEEGVYRHDLETPAAEEFELTSRLRERKIPILIGTRIVAFHNQHISLESLCNQAFKHAKGIAEVTEKYPETRVLGRISEQLDANGPLNWRDRPQLIGKKIAKRLLSSSITLPALTLLARYVERRMSRSHALPTIYQAVLGLHYFAGMRTGLRTYSNKSSVGFGLSSARKSGPRRFLV